MNPSAPDQRGGMDREQDLLAQLEQVRLQQQLSEERHRLAKMQFVQRAEMETLEAKMRFIREAELEALAAVLSNASRGST